MKLEKSYNTKQYFHSFYRQNHALLVLSFLFTVICFPANLIGSWLLGQVIDAITEASMNRLRTIILVSIIFIVTMFFFTILLYWFKSNFIRKALIQYKNLAFKKISEKNIAAFSRENTGSYISMLTNDAASIEENYLRKSFLILHYVLLFFGTLIMMFRYSIVLTVATIVLGFLPAIASILMGKELSSREKIVSDKNEAFVTQLKNLLAGFSVIKSFQAEKETQELFNTINARIEESKCILFDEATASLDKVSSYAITQEILRLEGVTRIVVSHQLDEALLRQYDEVVVIRDGTICEHGKYDELIARRSYFYSLYHVANG